MKITVETGKWASRYVEEPIIIMEADEGDTISDILEELGIPEDEAGMAVIDGNGVLKSHKLKNGDVVKIHPVIIGG